MPLGSPFSWRKVKAGRGVAWLGFELLMSSAKFGISAGRLEDLQATAAAILGSKGGTQELGEHEG